MLSAVIAFLGIGLFALPASILASGFLRRQARISYTVRTVGNNWMTRRVLISI
ncbi:hypothetical protein [Halegenticoccus tardaugens]|uniref:hypothetical protein n=1 Tax=Halegenticoccus tardaugens TaxID=2071624 RepID=UPI0037442ADA